MTDDEKAARIAELEQEIAETEKRLEAGVAGEEGGKLRDRLQTAIARLWLIQHGKKR